MKTIITFSGGVDSTYELWRLLTTTDDEITAVFVNIDNLNLAETARYDLRAFAGSNSTIAQSAATWLQNNCRSFTFLNQTFDTSFCVRGYGNVNSPQTYITRFAVPRINAGEFDRLICTSEKENDGWSNGGTVDVRRPGSFAARDLFVASATRGSIEFPLIALNYTQAVALASLPADLLAIVDTCPVDNMSFKCIKKRWFESLIAEGKTQQEIYNIWYNDCTTPYPGKWFSMKYWLSNIAPTAENTWTMPEWPTSYSA
jgi:hypothetical protein